MNWSLGFSDHSEFYTRFTYMFGHVNFWHLLVNSVSFIAMYRFMAKQFKHTFLLTHIVAIAFLSTFVSEKSIPTLGASGMVYAMVGMFYGLILNKKLTVINIKEFVFFCVIVWIGLISSYFREMSNFAVHFSCLLLGMIDGYINKNRAK